MTKLNLGCGNDIKDGYVNCDNFESNIIDVVHDLEKFPYPWEDNTFDEIILINVMEHLSEPIKVIEEIYRISKNNGKIIVRVPYYNSQDMFTDPTHKTFFNQYSFDFFDEDKRHCQERPYYSIARFSIEKISGYTSFIKNYKRIEESLWQSFLFQIAKYVGNIILVIEFDLRVRKK